MRVYHVLKGNHPKQYSRSSSDVIHAMADSQAFCLRRPNHTSDMLDVFDRMFKDESMTDCALVCGEGQAVKSHRMILSAASPFFKSVFDQMANYWPNYPIIYLKDMPIIDLRVIIEFIYRGEVTVSQTQLESVLRSAESLKIKGLEEIDRKEDGSYTATTISKKKRRRRPRKKSTEDQNPNEEMEDYDSQTTDDSLTECSDGEGSGHSMAETPTDMSGSRNYNESIGASEDGIEPSRLLEQSMITGDTQESNGLNQFSSASTPHPYSGVDDEDIKPIVYDEPIGLISQISSALSNDCNSDCNSALNHTSHETQTPLMHSYDTSGIPSIAGTSASNAFRCHSSDKRRSKSSKKSLHSRINVQSMYHIRQQRFHCSICHQGFTAKRNLQRHMQIHNYYRNKFECEHCQRQFSWKHTLNIHIEKAHNVKI